MSKDSSHHPLNVSAAGRYFKLGMVYNAYTHQLFESPNLLEKCRDVGTKTSICPSLSVDLKSSYTMSERLEAFRFDSHMEVKAVFGLINMGSASARYIHDTSSSIKEARMTLQYKQTKRYEELDTATISKLSNNRSNHEMFKSAKERGATHFVAGITYGNQVLIDFKFNKRHGKEQNLMDTQLKGLLSLGQFVADNYNKDKKHMSNIDDIQCKLFCESMDITQPTSFNEALYIYQNLPKTLQHAEAVDTVYLLPLSLIDKDAKTFKQGHINKSTMKQLVHIRDEILEHEMQCDVMKKAGINTSNIMHAIKEHIEDLKSTLSSTSVETWNQAVMKHNISKFHTQAFQSWMKEECRARTCCGCKRIFSTESELAEHTMMRYACPCRQCNKKFCSDYELAQHVKNHETHSCQRCKKEFYTKSELSEHMRFHEARTCRLCKDEFPTESDLAEHIRKKNVHPCHICKKEFYTKDEFLKHWVTCTAYMCHTCWKVYSSERELAEHKEAVKARTCSRCNKEFSSESELKEHMRNAEAVPRCHCTVQCCTESDLANHKKFYHVRTCRNCRKEFSTEEELEKHRNDIYDRTCRNCEMECSTKEELAKHMRDAKSLQCCKCRKDLCSEKDLAAHMQSDHGNTCGI